MTIFKTLTTLYIYWKKSNFIFKTKQFLSLNLEKLILQYNVKSMIVVLIAPYISINVDKELERDNFKKFYEVWREHN